MGSVPISAPMGGLPMHERLVLVSHRWTLCAVMRFGSYFPTNWHFVAERNERAELFCDSLRVLAVLMWYGCKKYGLKCENVLELC